MSRRRTIAVGAGLAAAAAAMLRRRSSRVPTDPLDPNAIRPETAAAQHRRARRSPAGPPSGSGADVRAGHRDLGRSPAPRPPLLPAHAGGHRGGPGSCAPAHLRLQAWRHRGDVPGPSRPRRRPGWRYRLAVDAIGSEVDFGSKDLFRRLREAGVEVVAHDGVVVVPIRGAGCATLPAARRGPPPFRPPQDGRGRREGRIRRRERHRGPLQRRALLRRDVPRRRAQSSRTSSRSSW